jgi:hypothetical protein
MIFRKLILLFIAIVFVQLIFAQSSSYIRAVVDKNKILIGEPVQLKIEAYLPSGAVEKFAKIDSIEHFEFLEKPSFDSTDKNGGLTIRGFYKLTSFDSGHWIIPSFFISQDVKTDTISIDVVFSDFDLNQPYHDIKDILEIKRKKNKLDWWWYAAGGILLVGLLLLYLKGRKKMQPVLVAKIAISPYEEAIKKLNQLERDKPDPKLFHSTLIDIFRMYIFRKKGILSLQKTTDNLVIQLKSLNLSNEQFNKLSQSLQLSDFVKFAKYIPANEDDRNSFNDIKNAITTIEKNEI